MVTRFSRYFQRSFAQFMCNLHNRKLVEKPTIKATDIESFFIHITELKARVDDLEEAISIHALQGGNTVHPHNKDLLDRCRITVSEAQGNFKQYLRDKEECYNSISKHYFVDL